MTQPLKTALYERHVALKAKMVEFGGWLMPIQYPDGIVTEHLATRKQAGLFDVSHMGRFVIKGRDRLPFLQHVLTNNAGALEIDQGQYTLIANEAGGAVDDAYLYRFEEAEYLLVVNAANRAKDWDHLTQLMGAFGDVEMEDQTEAVAMLSLQGPLAKKILSGIIDAGRLPEPMRNELSTVTIGDSPVRLARTGYTGEPICFELFLPVEGAGPVWDLLLQRGASAVGLGARDTLRLEAALPLYGHELGEDAEGNEIPIFSSPLSRFAVSLSSRKGEFVGRHALEAQFSALGRILDRDYSQIQDLPRITVPFEVIGRGVARAGSPVFKQDRHVGHVTSGTMVPYWDQEGEGIESRLTDQKAMRAIGLALLDSTLCEGDEIEIEVRGKKIRGAVVPYHLRSEAPPYARAITCHRLEIAPPLPFAVSKYEKLGKTLVEKSAGNTIWRQQACINLIPSEQTPSRISRRLSILDPVCRYAEHKPVKAFCEADVFYYQGTDFIAEVEQLLVDELRLFFGCAQVETRPVSGQMANTAVFSAIVDFINRADRKSEQRRIRYVLNNHIIKGGHLSAQPMGALRDFVARDPVTEKAAVVNFPVLADNPYKIDVEACQEVLETYRPELIIFGKSMTLHREPVSRIRAMVDDLGLNCFVMYDMAHVLGLVGPHFQQPFQEGADIITGSTHKTFFGTQRGIVATDFDEGDVRYDYWEAIQRRAFPGSTSNHHLGTLLGLLMAAYEMNAFKETYQPQVLANAKAFALALKACGLDVAGDPEISYTETHQVILNVGYAKGPEIAKRLEENNIIVNYQAAPDEEGFTASGALRMGVQEMTRFGMGPADFEEAAQLIADVVLKDAVVKETVSKFRKRFVDMKYCFNDKEMDGLLQAVGF